MSLKFISKNIYNAPKTTITKLVKKKGIQMCLTCFNYAVSKEDVCHFIEHNLYSVCMHVHVRQNAFITIGLYRDIQIAAIA